MSRHKNLMTRICFASVLSLGLAACGGKTVTPPTPMVAHPSGPHPSGAPSGSSSANGGAGCGHGGEDGG